MSLRALFSIFTTGAGARFFLVATILSFAFSQAVILSTFGLMDGFENTLRRSLFDSSGDFTITSRDGLFLSGEVQLDPSRFYSTEILELQAFATHNGGGHGVYLLGVDEGSFRSTTKIDLNFSQGDIVIGSELASSLGVSVGESLDIITGAENAQKLSKTTVSSFVVSDIIEHGIYEKDLRLIYLPLPKLTSLFGYKSLTRSKISVKNMSGLDEKTAQFLIEGKVSDKFVVKPSWMEYQTLIKALDIEKKTITLTLQMIVLVSIFNVLGFIVFISQKRKKELFLIRALGLPSKAMAGLWFKLIFLIWLCSFVIAQVMTWFFDKVILKSPFLAVPGEIYILEQLEIKLDPMAYLSVGGLSLVWVFIIGFVVFRRLKNKPAVSGLREEFQ